MRNPYPVNLMTPEESRALGWAAEERDSDGHLITQHAPFASEAEKRQYTQEAEERGNTVTIWIEKVRPR